MSKKNVLEMYKLPKKVVYCKKCTISNQRPRITFDNNGICSACQYAEFKRNDINWDKRERELRELLDKHRKKDGSYDVIVPCSGGKDGSYVAHQLKYKYDMNPLTVTWAPHLPTELGQLNLKRFVDSGFDNIYGTPNGKVHRLMTKLSFLHLGDPFQPFIYGQTNFPLKIAVQNKISLIMYGENGEVEYGGSMKNAFQPTREIKDHDEHYFSGLPPEFWLKHGISKKDIVPYLAPKYEDIVANNTEIHFFGYYKFWDPHYNYIYCKEHVGFEAETHRSEGTYTNYASLDDKIDGFHYYLAYIKFGLGRTTSDTAHEIRDGKISREEGIELVKKYDSEFPSRYYKEFLKYCDITEEAFNKTIDSWRSEHLWVQNNGLWKLKVPVY